jgi:hypothetical protein
MISPVQSMHLYPITATESPQGLDPLKYLTVKYEIWAVESLVSLILTQTIGHDVLRAVSVPEQIWGLFS